MGKKIQSEMDAQRQQFVAGAVERGVERARAELIFDQMAKFAGYGFNKSHAAAYALVAYQTAYLKANHPVEFMAASMTLDLGNTDKLAHFRPELDRLGIKLLPPDINRSEVTFAVEADPKTGNPAIRYALAAVKGVGAQAMEDIVAERGRNGPFRDLFDFAARLDTKSFNRRQFESLVKAGAFDCLDPNRAQSFAAAELLLRQASRAAEERESRQENLFAGIAGLGHGGFAARPSLPLVPDWPPVEKLTARVRRDRFLPLGAPARSVRPQSGARRHPALGRSAGSARRECQHPVPAGRDRDRPEGAHLGARQPLSLLSQLSDNSERQFRGHGVLRGAGAGARAARSRTAARSSRSMCAARTTDLRLTAQKIEPVDSVVAHATAGLRVFVAEAEALPRLKSLISREAGGRGRVTVVLDLPSREIELALPGGFRINPGIRAAVKSLPGILDVHDI